MNINKTTDPADVNCLDNRHWFYFLASSLIIFFSGLIIILIVKLTLVVFHIYKNEKHKQENNILQTSTINLSVAAVVPKVLLPSTDNDDDEQQKNGGIRLYTTVKNHCQALISGQTLTGRIMISLSCLLSIGSLVIYLINASLPGAQVETCSQWNSSVTQQLDFSFNVFFLLYFIIRFIAANDKLFFWLEINSLVDFFTIPPVFVGIALNRQWLGLRFLRAIRLLNVPDILQYLGILKTGVVIRFAQLISIFTSVWLASAGFIHLLELSGDPWVNFKNAQDITYWECVYFVIVTMSTVGYGDLYCETTLGRAFMVIFIFAALAMFASFIPEIAEIIQKRKRYDGFYEIPDNGRHVVVTGYINYESVNNFIRDFFHIDRDTSDVKSVFLDNRPPDLELEALFKRHIMKLAFIRGSVMNIKDLQKVRLQDATACMIMANLHSADPDSEDAANIMRVISVKNFHPKVRVIVQLMHYHNKAFCVNLPSWRLEDQVVCLSEMKLGFMAAGCLAPGISTLVANLFIMLSYKRSAKRVEWEEHYLRGTGMEVYCELFSKSFYTISFPTVAALCYSRLNLLLVAVTVGSSGGVVLNPGPEISIDSNTKGFIICQSEEEAKRILYYCSLCHANLKDPKDIRICNCEINTKLSNKRISSVCCGFTRRGQKSPGNSLLSNRNGSKKLELTVDDQQHHQIHVEDDLPSICLDEQFESTGLFHWCPQRSFEHCILTNEKNDKNRQVVRNLNNHVILCCFAEASSALIGLCNFVMPLRASSLRMDELKPVVIIANEAQYLRREWKSICNFPDVYMRVGSPLNRSVLRHVKIDRCYMCVVLTANEAETTDDVTLIDKESILCTLNIKTMKFQAHKTDLGHRPPASPEILRQRVPASPDVTPKSVSNIVIPLLTELANEQNVQFIDQDDDDDPNAPLYMTQPYASGRAFVASLLHTLMITTYFNPESLSLIRNLVTGGHTAELELILAEGVGLTKCQLSPNDVFAIRNRCRIALLPLDGGIFQPYSGSTYGQLFNDSLTNYGILCLGLYRLINTNALNSFRYVITNPHSDFKLLTSDKVYCLRPFIIGSSSSAKHNNLETTTKRNHETRL